MSKWINTKNKLPQDGALVFVHYMTKKGERHYGIAHCHYDEGIIIQDGYWEKELGFL